MFERGQISLLDFMFALFIFLFVFAALNTVWTQNVSNLKKMQEFTEMQFKATQAMDTLTETMGFPENWEENVADVNMLGLMKVKGVIHEDKLAEFNAMDYGLTKSLMKIERFDYFLKFDSREDAYDFEKGVAIPADRTVVTLRRVMKYGGEECAITFSLFE